MELWLDEQNAPRNKLGEHLDLESDYLFPFSKMFRPGKWQDRTAAVCFDFTQTRVGEDTFEISKIAPRTWKCPDSHRELSMREKVPFMRTEFHSLFLASATIRLLHGK